MYPPAGYGGRSIYSAPTSSSAFSRGVNSSPLAAQYANYSGAVKQQGADYSGLMGQYQNMYQGAYPRFTPSTTTYTPSADRTAAIGNLANLSKTGGYSDQDIQNIRARSISPIRSIYSSAMRNVDRQRGLQGGFSPNYGAVQAKMARDLSSQIGDQSTNVNATIAEMIARNKMAAAPEYASAATSQDQFAQEQAQRNAEIENQSRMFNITQPLQQQETALGGQRGLYGTTPALSSLFGSQAMSAADLQDRINQQQRQTGLSLIGMGMRG